MSTVLVVTRIRPQPGQVVRRFMCRCPTTWRCVEGARTEHRVGCADVLPPGQLGLEDALAPADSGSGGSKDNQSWVRVRSRLCRTVKRRESSPRSSGRRRSVASAAPAATAAQRLDEQGVEWPISLLGECTSQRSPRSRGHHPVAAHGRCARATSGHAAAPPSSAMNSRRLMCSPLVRGSDPTISDSSLCITAKCAAVVHHMAEHIVESAAECLHAWRSRSARTKPLAR